MSEYTRQLITVIERIRALSEGEALTIDERLFIQTLEHFIRRPDLTWGSAEFAIRRAVPSWWLNTALWWHTGELSIFGSYVERETVRSIRGEVIHCMALMGMKSINSSRPGEFCYACRQWQSKAAFNWAHRTGWRVPMGELLPRMSAGAGIWSAGGVTLF